MLWTPQKQFSDEPFETEAELEAAVVQFAPALFGPHRIYLDVKRLIGTKGKIKNVPDGYLLDLSSKKEPALFVVEAELARHDPLNHIAVQILEFSLSFEASAYRVKTILREALNPSAAARKQCDAYAVANGFENLDYLLERMLQCDDAFKALVIIDDLDEELETVLLSRFKFPVEILTIKRFKAWDGERAYEFEPFLADVAIPKETTTNSRSIETAVDWEDIDTIVVPAHEEGFKEVFLGENRWHHIRIHSSMIPRIKYVAVYQVMPVAGITHFAPVKNIELWRDTNKYVLNFAEPAKPIGPIKLVPGGGVRAPQAPRYTSLAQLQKAKSLDEAF
jgi:hypothetical protein